MKPFLLLFTALFFTTICRAQNVNSAPRMDSLKVSLLNDSMTVMYKGHLVPVQNSHGLDSLMKTLPNLKQLKVEFSSENGAAEKRRTISRILDQCECDIIKKSRSFMSNN